MSLVPIPKLIFKIFHNWTPTSLDLSFTTSLCKSAHFKSFFSLLNTPWSSGNKKNHAHASQDKREDHQEIICSLRLGLLLFFKFFSISFGRKIIFESKSLTVLWINSTTARAVEWRWNVSRLDPTKSTTGKRFIQKAAVSWTPKEGKCPTTRPRGLRVRAPPAFGNFSGSHSLLSYSRFCPQYLESSCVRREASQVEFGTGAEPAKQIVSIHLYPESSAVSQRLRRGLPLPEGLGRAEVARGEGGASWLWEVVRVYWLTVWCYLFD